MSQIRSHCLFLNVEMIIPDLEYTNFKVEEITPDLQ